MPTVSDVLEIIESFAPSRWAFSFDKVGLQVGRKYSEIKSAVVSLDWSDELLEFAKLVDSNLIICHHPIIWEPLTELTEKSRSSEMALRLAECGIAMIASHTNWDSAPGGINDALANVLGLKDVTRFGSAAEATVGNLQYPEMPAGRLGELSTKLRFLEYVVHTETKLDTKCWAWGDPDRMVSKVAVVGGGADSEWAKAFDAGADVFLTGEVKQDRALDAVASGICVIAAGHYATEQPGMAAFRNKIADLMPKIEWHLFVPEPGASGRPL